MKVILTDHVEHLGERGDAVTVKPGYARNYLLPKGLAYLDTPGNRKLFQQQQSGWEAMDLERRSTAEKVASEMAGVELHFERRAGERDVLFGSVTVVDIARELSQRGFELERRKIRLDQPIKTLGTSQVEIAIHRDITVAIPVHVTRPGDQGEPGQESSGESPAAEATTPSGSDQAAG